MTIAPQMTRYSPLRISAWGIPLAAVLLFAAGSEGLSLVQVLGGLAIAAGIVFSRGGRATAVRLQRRVPAEVPPVSE